MAKRMHANEVETDEALVRRLLAEQFPDWATHTVERVHSAGTDNAIYRLGPDLVVRMPRIHWATSQIETERRYLPLLRPHLPLALPEQVAVGEPGQGYLYTWAVYQWLPGEDANHVHPTDMNQAAKALGQFVAALRNVDPSGGRDANTHRLRGSPLRWRDKPTREAIAQLEGMYDTRAILASWEESLDAAEWEGSPTWFHGDLLPGNVLLRDGRVSAVIDFSGLGVGDPVCDLMIAWALFDGESRGVFRRAAGADDAQWLRGRGIALSQAVIFIPYYLTTNPAGVAAARRSLEAVLAESGPQ